MKESTKKILVELTERYPTLHSVKENVQTAFEVLKVCFENGNRLYLCGNGGSSSDCEHMAGELLKSFKKTRPLSIELENKLKEYGTEGEKLT